LNVLDVARSAYSQSVRRGPAFVFANAGISGRTPSGSTDEVVFENVIHTNLNVAFFTVNSAAPLLNDNGRIIFNGRYRTV